MYTPTLDELKYKQNQMVKLDIANRGILNPLILSAMSEVPRHEFLDPKLWEQAYEDQPLPIAEHQTLSQPYMVAKASELLELSPGHKVLEVGSGAGYQAAILGKIVAQVIGVEYHKELADTSVLVFNRLGYRNIRIHHGDGKLGRPAEAPFDRILVSCAVKQVPQAWLDQLKDEGILVFPQEDAKGNQVLCRWRKKKGAWALKEELFGVRYVPLL